MRILLASSEVHPFSKTGGLADMVAGLANAMARKGHRLGLVTPLYQGIRERFPAIQPDRALLQLPLGSRLVEGTVCNLDWHEKLTIYFIAQSEFYDRAGLYQEKGADYPDNAERFIFFSKAVTHLARTLDWTPELIHVHDWQVGLVPLFLFDLRWRQGWGTAPPTCLTIHNLAYQGIFPATTFSLTNLSWDYFNPDGAEFYGQLNCLKAGIAYAQGLTTVSPRYAREIATEAYGCGLDGLLRKRQHALTGILNGIDEQEWTTLNNPYLQHSYSEKNLRGKEAEKLALQRDMGLPVSPHIPLFSNITRLVNQKGVDIQLGALEEMLAANMQFILLGSGSGQFESAYLDLARRHAGKVAVRIGFDQELSHRIEAGSDFYLMPSQFEPCGLNQMYSLRYGTIPIVRVTGGLDDSVIDPGEDLEHANGIKFSEFSARALAKAIRKALVLYQEPQLLQHFRQNAMASDFSWDQTAEEYLKLYSGLLKSQG